MKSKGILYPTLALTVICLVVTALIAFANQVTYSKIAENAEKEKAAVSQQVLSQATEFKALDAAENVVSAQMGMDESGNTVGYVFETVAAGYGGDISVMTGVDINGKITGVKILSCEETPGLGKKAEDDSFLSQYKDASGTVAVVKGDSGDNEISAISGATISSTAVTEAVNKALDAFKAVKGE